MGMCRHYKNGVCDLTNQRVSDSVKKNTCYTSAHEKCETYKRNLKGGGCFITTAVCETLGKTDDCHELMLFRSFRDDWLTKQDGGPAAIEQYYACAPGIVEQVESISNAATIWQDVNERYIVPCVTYLEQNDNAACYRLYQEMVDDLSARYC